MRRSQPLLGTFVVVAAWGPDRALLQAAAAAAFEEVRRVDAVMSGHRADSELSRLNARAGEGPVPVSAELYDIVALALEVARKTGGAFDPTVGPVTELWGFLWKEYRLPTPEELAGVLPRVNYRLVKLDPAARTIELLLPGVTLDLGGIAKGYAVDRAIEVMRARGTTNALVRAGGDLRVMGLPPGQPYWVVQLEDPAKQGRRTRVALREGALSTSGSYENYFEVGGRRYSHLLDPRTGLPLEEVAACSVLAPTCVESDAWATACLIYGVEASLATFGAERPLRFTVLPDGQPGMPPAVRCSPLFPVPLRTP